MRSPAPRVLVLVAVIGAGLGCSNSATPPGGGDGNTPTPLPNSYTFVGAGDIAECGKPGSEQTAKILDDIPGDIFTAGDNAYPSGTPADFRDCYNPTWGRHKARTHPTPGNHDYETAGAAGYYAYFGPDAMGPDGSGYYSYNVGSWTVFTLNSELGAAGVRSASAQYRWLRDELGAIQTTPCVIAIWHRPLYTSGPNLPNPDMRDIFRLLYDFKADIVINGHDHLYERFAPQDADGRADSARGLRQFTVGTGGVAPYQPNPRQPNSERLFSVTGVLKLQLGDRQYTWDFIPTSGPHDTGAGACH